MNNVYAFEWCSCIFESDFTVKSLHTTKRGAFKAMTAYANAQWTMARESYLLLGREVFHRFDKPLIYERWRVTTMALQAD
jgi:hypothetical protein